MSPEQKPKLSSGIFHKQAFTHLMAFSFDKLPTASFGTLFVNNESESTDNVRADSTQHSQETGYQYNLDIVQAAILLAPVWLCLPGFHPVQVLRPAVVGSQRLYKEARTRIVAGIG